MTGKVKMVKTDKGFGFISGDDGVEYFFHHSGLERGQFDKLVNNDKVEFEPTTGSKGPRAERILKI